MSVATRSSAPAAIARGEQREVLRVHEPPPMVAGLGPGVGVEQEDAPDRGRRQDLDEVARVAGVEADVPDPRLLDAAQGHRHPVHEGLAADQPDAGMGHGLRDEVLAPAEADLEPERQAAPKSAARSSGWRSGPAAGPPVGTRSRGSSSSRSRRCVGFSFLPWRRP